MVQYANPIHRRTKQFVSLQENCCYWPEHFQSQESVEDFPESVDLVCFSHIRWDLVFQRPQHLMSRWAKERRVFFIEEPVFSDIPRPRIESHQRDNGVFLITPHLPVNSDPVRTQKKLMQLLFTQYNIRRFIAWYLSPMFLNYSSGLKPSMVVYDCMDELSGFAGAPATIREAELMLFDRSHLVFTGGLNLFEAKKSMHPNIHAFPSSIDFNHFSKARDWQVEPDDQSSIPHPRIGYFGVIDERMNLQLVQEIADERPDWHIIMIGPVLKIDPAALPQRHNIHYLGKKDYLQLPSYLASWNVAMLPFALNEATQYISPTKTPEYLAAGRPVVSTSIRDVVRPYGEAGLAEIADTSAEFIEAIERCLNKNGSWLKTVDTFLTQTSWDLTWSKMKRLVSGSWHNAQSRRADTPTRIYTTEANLNV